MPIQLPEQELQTAAAAIEFAQQVRTYHRRRTRRGSVQREQDIELALARIKEAMAPLRSIIGKFPYGPQGQTAEDNRQTIRDMSDALQRERRKLHKMKIKEEPNDRV